ncbi:CHAT domain-containing protein [Microbacterium sp. SD291]|uniref:CHAT domain-containing protein n=1 Tax=Microbacterium sp. SD291 TaxID=2782007 RepID=UPI001A96AD66|nr:CHAT domain-containing protein [Microbacterium sp. SD291]MBO0980782.1 CHAT domain-containing protein [Microbacterium sp. SD291]
MFISTVTVDANQRMADAAERAAGISDDAYVVVRRRADDALFFYAFTIRFLRAMAVREPDAAVVDALNLHESGAMRTVQLAEARQADAGTAVVLDGDAVAGVLMDVSGGRGVEAGPPPAMAPPPAPMAPPPAPMAPPPVSPAAPPPASAPPPAPGPPPASAPPPDLAPATDLAPPPASAPPAEVTEGSAGAEAPVTSAGEVPVTAPAPSAAQPFTASPRIDCPTHATVGRPFDVVVGLGVPPSAGAVDGAVVVDTVLAEFDLVVSMVAHGFSATRTRDVLHVVRADPESGQVTFTVTADPIEGAIASALVFIDFSFGGVLCGRAWRPIAVSADGIMPAIPAPAAGAQGGLTTPVQVVEAERPPDLVVTISENDDSTQLEWQFESRHQDVALPRGQVRTRFRQHNAKSFAMQQVRLIHENVGAAAVGNRVLGVARTIADQVPSEAWQALSEVWRRTALEHRPPSVLLVSTDAYIPWELASTEAEYIDQQLVDTALPPLFGAQLCVSRWNAPRPRGTGGMLYPPLPPPESLDVRTVTLVIGDYLATSGQRALPKASEEGNELAALYRAVRLTATLGELDALFDGTLEHDGAPVEPDLVHFACHGQIDPNPRFNGIVLNEGNARLDALYVAGSRLRRSFVFVNACQIGQSTELLDDAGGLATSFLRTGAAGFVAPLWNVDDQVAKDTALGFYQAALDERVPVAEALRRRRAMFDPDAADPQTTHLAYIYYGHPNLVLARTA